MDGKNCKEIDISSDNHIDDDSSEDIEMMPRYDMVDSDTIEDIEMTSDSDKEEGL